MAAKNNQPIIVKKVKKVAAGHHGGAWKIAYADFVTAMMAFFLLMWLLNATTEEQKRGIANYFDPMSLGKLNGGGLGVMGGEAIKSKEGSLDQLSPNNSIKPSPPVEKGNGGEDKQQQGEDKIKQPEMLLASAGTPKAESADNQKEQAKKEQELFKEIKESMMKEMENNPELKDLLKNLIIDETEEGLRIQIIDHDKQSMFPSGSAKMYDYTQKLINKVAQIILTVPNKISISGHTDAIPFNNNSNYGNWELSTDRASATLRVLKEAGIDNDRINAVVGKAEMELFNKDDPKSPQNRRISIILQRQAKVSL